MKIKPFVTFSHDYFELIKLHFEHAGISLSYKEIGCFTSKLSGNRGYGMHHAIFFHPEDESSQEVQDLVEEYKSYSKQ